MIHVFFSLLNSIGAFDGLPKPCVVVLGLALTICAPVSAEENRIALDASDSAVERRLLDDVRYLASDELEGRGLTTQGIERAAEHIAKSYRKSGLKADHFAGSPYQVFHTRRRLALGEGNRLRLVGPGGKAVELKLGVHFNPISISASGEIDVPLVFAGYGITDPESGYDDYADLDVKGKAVIVMRHEPRQDDPESPFNGVNNSEHAYLIRKALNAEKHGAAMILFCSTHHALSDEKPPKKDALLPFDVRSSVSQRPLPTAHVLRAALDEVLVQLDPAASLRALEEAIDEDLKPRSRLLQGWRAVGKISVARKGNGLKNVIASLEAEGAQADETIVLGAHYDHLGRGGSGSLAPWTKAIHNGADDNGSGTVVLLEVARQLAARRVKLKRRVLFICFSAEESGLIGSAHYVRHPLFSIDNTVAMVNLDMVGRLRKDKLTVYGTGTATEFDALADRLGDKYGFKLTKLTSGYGPSDHASFHAARVPVLHLFTGLHSDYHRPSDDTEKLNLDGMRRIARMTTDLVAELATADKRPTARRKRSSAVPTVRRGPPKGRLGIAIKTSQKPVGCKVISIREKGPGENAGVRVGDVITHLNDTEVESVARFLELFGEVKEEEVKLKVDRNGLKLGMTLKAPQAK